MNKRMLPLLLVLVLALAPFMAMAENAAADTEAQRIAKHSQLVEDYLASEQYRFSHHEGDNSFTFDVPLDNVLSSCNVRIDVDKTLVMVLAFASINVPAENRLKMAKLVTLINWEHYYAQMFLDMDTGELAASANLITAQVYPGQEELAICVGMPLYLLERYGDAVARVALMGEDPQAAFDAVNPLD